MVKFISDSRMSSVRAPPLKYFDIFAVDDADSSIEVIIGALDSGIAYQIRRRRRRGHQNAHGE